MVVILHTTSLPYKLLEGEQWSEFINQTKDLEEMANNGFLEVNIHVAGRRKPKKTYVN